MLETKKNKGMHEGQQGTRGSPEFCDGGSRRPLGVVLECGVDLLMDVGGPAVRPVVDASPEIDVGCSLERRVVVLTRVSSDGCDHLLVVVDQGFFSFLAVCASESSSSAKAGGVAVRVLLQYWVLEPVAEIVTVPRQRDGCPVDQR